MAVAALRRNSATALRQRCRFSPDESKTKGGISSIVSLFSTPSTSGIPRRVPNDSPPEVQSGDPLPEMESLVGRLKEEGYLKDSTFSEGIPADDFLQGSLIGAAERFGDDRQEIAKWLSGSSLKKVALSRCPSTDRKPVFAAKRLRSFFIIQEDAICQGCPAKKSCKFANRGVDKQHRLSLADVMRVLTTYACGDGMKSHGLRDYVRKSLKEVISLSA